MDQLSFPFPRPSFRLALFGPVLLAMLCSCASNDGHLRLESMDAKHAFQQTFSQAYYTRNDSGDADIVLIQNNIHPVSADSSKPQPPDACVLPRELVHIRVFWIPMSGVKADHPANTNASIHWCFICDNRDQAGVLEYSGSGLVMVDTTGTGLNVTIRKAWMKPAAHHGAMADPLGPCILQGTFKATKDDAEVKAVIAQIKSASSNTDEARVNDVSPLN